jgi:serine/threonine-protein kinase
MALEYVEGESAADVLQRVQTGAKLNWRHGLRLAVHVARALDFIHRNHQSHGNVTPRNILIRLGDKLTKLSDWELTKALEGTALHKARLEKKRLAELPFLAPEQVDPKAFTDNLSDVYNLGAVVYARLTGRPPFQSETAEDTIAQILEGRLVKPRQLQPSIPARLEAVVLKMLALRQEERFQSSRELLDFLEHVAKQEEVPV